MPRVARTLGELCRLLGSGFLSREEIKAALNERGLNEAGLQARPRPALAHSHYRFGRSAPPLYGPKRLRDLRAPAGLLR